MPSQYNRPQPKTAAVHGGTTVSTSAVVIGSGLQARSSITIWNLDTTVTLYVGVTSSVVATLGNANCGIPVPPGGYLALDYSDKLPVYGIAASSISVGYAEAA